jgi:phosphoenolpyruvate synthase/pyruvate phosphate dikinase
MKTSTVLEKIKKVDWQYLVNRRESLLFSSTTDSCYNYKKFEKATRLKWNVNFVMRFSDGDLLHSAEDLMALRDIFVVGGLKLFIAFSKRLVAQVKYFDRFVRGISKIDYIKLNQKKLSNLARVYFDNALLAHDFLVPMPVADRALSKMLMNLLPEAGEAKKQKWLISLTYPIKENEHTKEERAFYRLAEAYLKKDKNINKLIDRHTKKFAWIGTRGYWWKWTWTKKDVEERLKIFLAQNKNPRKEIKYLDSIRKERKAAASKLLKELKIKKDSSFYKLILLAKEFAYLRTWRTDLLYGAGHRARNLFFEIARRAGVDQNDLCYLTFYEVIKLAENKKMPISPKEINDRKKYFVAITIKSNYQVFSGKKNYKKIRAVVKSKVSRTREIRGNIAYSGKARGRVKLVLTGDDVRKVKRGDILVAVMTFPNFVPAMERAAAFVTDEGGILCHAAIVSREMKKPCIIGTKVATKVLKDGQLVEVDANRGVVKIIK